MASTAPARPTADVASILDEMAAEGAPAEVIPLVPRKPQLGKVRYTHEACIDMILANPGISQNELAALFGYSATWMSIAINSDAFQARLAERKAELVDPVVRASLNERLRAVTQTALDTLLDKLNKPSAQVSDQLALGAASLGIKGLGLGNAPGNAPPAADHLNALADRLRSFMKPQGPALPPADVVDVPSREVPPS